MSKAIPHRYGFVTSALHFVLAAGLRCSDRQRQPLARPAQVPGKIWSSDVDRQ